MALPLILPWFPIILSAAVGGRLVGPQRSTWLGMTCALFWVVVVQTAAGPGVWASGSTMIALVAGAVSIVGMSVWSAGNGSGREESAKGRGLSGGKKGQLVERRWCGGRGPVGEGCGGASGTHPTGGGGAWGTHPTGGGSDLSVLEGVTGLLVQFEDWLEAHRESPDPWPAFGEFVRGVLFSHCQAAHVRPYRILSEGEELVPLRDLGAAESESLESVRAGIRGHVVTTGRSYVAGEEGEGALVKKLAEATAQAPVWCFAIRQGGRTIGLVESRQWSGSDRPAGALLRTTELLVGQFWGTVGEVCRRRAAVHTERATGLLTREAFLQSAGVAAEESFGVGEPVAFGVIVLEGVRGLADAGRWERADEVVLEASRVLRARVRPDDLVGRFDDSRFVVLLRRVDSGLASLIAKQLVGRLMASRLCAALPQGKDGVHCGIVGSGTGRPGVSELVVRAVRLCEQAREQEVNVVSDVAGAVEREVVVS